MKREGTKEKLYAAICALIVIVVPFSISIILFPFIICTLSLFINNKY